MLFGIYLSHLVKVILGKVEMLEKKAVRMGGPTDFSLERWSGTSLSKGHHGGNCREDGRDVV